MQFPVEMEPKGLVPGPDNSGAFEATYPPGTGLRATLRMQVVIYPRDQTFRGRGAATGMEGRLAELRARPDAMLPRREVDFERLQLGSRPAAILRTYSCLQSGALEQYLLFEAKDGRVVEINSEGSLVAMSEDAQRDVFGSVSASIVIAD
jgi:hypothetical protein